MNQNEEQTKIKQKSTVPSYIKQMKYKSRQHVCWVFVSFMLITLRNKSYLRANYRFLFLIIINVGLAQGELCSICNCVFINQKKLEPKVTDIYNYNVEPFTSNATTGSLQKYLRVQCQKINSGLINNAEWPDLEILGITADFSNGDWKTLEPFPESFKKLIINLSLSKNLLSLTETSQLDHFINLKKLNLSQNQIQTIKKEDFQKLKSLKILDLSMNWINEIEDYAFYGTELQFINLSKNHLNQINSDVFRGLDNLVVLDLSDNKLTKLPNEFGNYLSFLKVLNIKGNNFMTLPELPKNLKELDVSQNLLTDLHLSHYILQVLSVDNNKLYTLEHTNLPNLMVFSVSHNNISQIIDLNANRVTVLDLSYNKFSQIPRVVTSDKLPFLAKLYLDGNPITNISFSNQSEPFSDLTVLSLSHLKSVKKITKNSFQGIFSNFIRDCSSGNGIDINLSHNSIKFVDKDSFHSFPLCSINLSHNQLRSLSAGLLPYRKMSYINLQYNPWQCDCNLQWMIEDFLTFMVNNQPRLLFSLRCDTPQRFNNKMMAFWYNKNDQIFCNSGPSSFYVNIIGGKRVEIWTASAITCVILACIIFVTAIIIIVLACYKPSRKSKTTNLKTKKKGLPFYKKIQSADDKNSKLNENYF